MKLRNNREEIFLQLKELGYKVELMEKNQKEAEKSIAPERKKQIAFLLKERKMTSPEVGKALGISRSRANEYLKFMEGENLLAGEKRGRKKYYTIKEGTE